MTSVRTPFSRLLPFALLAGVALVPAGCGGDGVRKYDAPKSSERAPETADKPAAGEFRLLGLMVPADNPQWFFKYNGTADEITKHEADFDKLAAGVQLAGGQPDFAVPDGWKRGPGRDGFVKVFATVKPDDGKQEVSITQSGGGVETNLGRWVGQIGLKAGPDDVAKYTKAIDGKGVKVLRVDLRGPKDPTTSRGPMMGGGLPPGHP
jgi:hypothetical protein